MAKIILTGGPSFALFNPSLHVSLGLLYLGAALREAGHDVKIVDCHKLTAWDEERQKLTMQWIITGDLLLFEELFLKPLSHQFGDEREITGTESIDQLTLIAA